MVEIFQTILANPWDFIMGLGCSGATAYVVYAILKWIVSKVFKKALDKKQQTKDSALADLILNKLIGAETFLDVIAKRIVDSFTESQVYQMMKDILKSIKSSANCPVEVKAYINTILSQSGNEDLMLIYEQMKSGLIKASKKDCEEIIEEGILKQEEKDDILIPEEPKTEQPEDNKHIEQVNVTEPEEGDIEYA